MSCAHDPYEDRCDECEVCLGCDGHLSECSIVRRHDEPDPDAQRDAERDLKAVDEAISFHLAAQRAAMKHANDHLELVDEHSDADSGL